MSRLISEQQAADLLMEADNILLLAHRYPDGDTIGSNYALCLALRSLGKQVRVLCGDPIPERFDYITEGVEMPDFEPAFICAVDVADPTLLGEMVNEAYGHRVDLCIDHHSTNVGYAAATCVDGDCAAAAMVVMRITGYRTDSGETVYVPRSSQEKQEWKVTVLDTSYGNDGYGEDDYSGANG